MKDIPCFVPSSRTAVYAPSAQRMPGDKGLARHAIIEIGPDEFPECSDRSSSAMLHAEYAERIERSLRAALPGGTYDALLRRMLLHRASHFVVPFEDESLQKASCTSA